MNYFSYGFIHFKSVEQTNKFFNFVKKKELIGPHRKYIKFKLSTANPTEINIGDIEFVGPSKKNQIELKINSFFKQSKGNTASNKNNAQNSSIDKGNMASNNAQNPFIEMERKILELRLKKQNLEIELYKQEEKIKKIKENLQKVEDLKTLIQFK
ncbi:hypothetical protein RirG_068980 [Rhizophagus irregularis DAOM 197198w]|uniref:Uncharacterized protein n=1 Tax=Rhizophagus irregularis (strain DAOM 197198w) TaxID=1432141 RepID=A0A015JF88_RHIIW|nr:hypothetical protein RirG_272530 [Rhizophagus irregularis DAOM 197198w]EXX65569.1 hypothetical protein RirG_131970 [Rhizophagus irregularis DAOM 197198w]EXX65740.1 hypothetical protein RirG_130350 [Rhizophagus irregularis DAOM 197198w]EXX72478.1 hypothetical protein RirG_068980 [Rhizophagus irregularis DAOM 197198w]